MFKYSFDISCGFHNILAECFHDRTKATMKMKVTVSLTRHWYAVIAKLNSYFLLASKSSINKKVSITNPCAARPARMPRKIA